MHFPNGKAVCLSLILSQASALPQESSILGDTLSERDGVSANAVKYLKNCAGTNPNYPALEKEAWDVMQDLANAAKKWQKGGAYQSTAEMYFGGDAGDNYARIQRKSRPSFFTRE